MTDRITANLPAIDMHATASFYERLGFSVDFKDAGWMILSRGPFEIEFFPYPDLDPYQSSFSACLRTADLDGLWREWASLGLPTVGIPRLDGPARSIGHGLRMFALIDPNGSLIRCIGQT
jgi:hypothetical protein